MPARINTLLEEIGKAARGLPDVFSTTQWGGRAYKLPGPGGNRRKPKLLAFVCTSKEGDAVSVSFKLEKQRAQELVERYAWIEPHSFGTLQRSGWLSARLSQKRQLGTLRKLLGESRTLYPQTEDAHADVKAGPDEGPDEGPDAGPGARRAAHGRSRRPASAEAARLDSVMHEAREAGWSPPPEVDDRFDR